MRILIANHIYLETDFSSTTQRQVVRALNKLGHPTRLLVPTTSPEACTSWEPDIERVPVRSQHSAVSSPLFNLKLVRRLAGAIRNERPDVILVDHVSFGGVIPFIPASAVSKRFPRLVFDVRSQPVEGDGLIARLRGAEYLASLAVAARVFPGVTFLTEAMGRTELHRVGSSRSYGVWESGVDLELFDPNQWAHRAEELRESLGLKECLVVLYHGVVSPNRGLEKAVAAVASLSSKAPRPVLVILGDGEARQELENLARRISAPVRFLGRVPYEEVPAHIAMSDVCLIPLPDHDDWRYQHPLKFSESLAMGVPVIASRIPAFTEIAGDSKAVLYLREPTQEAITESVAHCMANRERLSEWGREGCDVANRFSWESVAGRLVSYMETIL
jgi:glycosyltransferase involved in cell wall biosynthesis